MDDLLPRIELLTLNDEFLLGIRPNNHLKYIGAQLERHGLKLARNIVIRDDMEEIKTSFRHSWERSDIVIITGGLGATRVSNTREAIAESLNIGLEFVESIQKQIENHFASINRAMGKRYTRQCYKLEGSELINNDFGTAPGILFKQGKKILIMLPGAESELKPMLENKVIPQLQDQGLLQSSHAYLQLRTFGMEEDALNEKIEILLEKHPELTINYSQYQGVLDIRLSSEIRTFTHNELQKIGQECKKMLGNNFFTLGHKTLAEGIFNQLQITKKTLATAESCTGGKLADAFTNIPGASQVFSGGMVCYNNEAKVKMLEVPESILKQHGAVSAETAIAMASGVAKKYNTDYGLSTTGYAGPDGGDVENPVGTVYIGYHSPTNSWAHKIIYPGKREAIKARAVNAAFDFMRRKLKEECVEEYIKDLDH